jgi:nitroreductase
MMLNLSADDVLTTTRAVRKRLDFDRPVEPDVIRECIAIAQQAPTGSNRQTWHFVVVTDPDLRRGIGDLYRRGYEGLKASPGSLYHREYDDPDRNAAHRRVFDSADYLAERMHEAPVLLIPCIEGRTEGTSIVVQSAQFADIHMATWSFMLAARERGLGTSLTTMPLIHEQEAAALLGIPYDEVMQTALVPVAYTKGTGFRPAKREPVESVMHWKRW